MSTKAKQLTLLSKVRLIKRRKDQPERGWTVCGFHGSLEHGVWWYLRRPDGAQAAARSEDLELDEAQA